MRIQRPVERRFSQPMEKVCAMIKALETMDTCEMPGYLSKIDEWKHCKTDLVYWVEVLDRFDTILQDLVQKYRLDGLQSQPMEPQDRDVAREILRFQKVLVENSSNKSIFNSFDVIEHLIYSFELDLAIEALYLVCFFSSKIHIQRSIRNSMSLMSMETLNVLVDRVRSKPLQVFSYYDEQQKKTVRLSLSKVLKKGIYNLNEKLVPKTETKRLSHALRSFHFVEETSSLAVVKMLGFGALVYYKHTDLSIDSEFIGRDLVEVLDVVKNGEYRLKEAGLVMIDALFRMRIRHSALIGAMDSHLHDGMVMATLSRVVNEQMPEHFVVSFFNLLSSFFASAPGASALYSAGIVQYICSTLRDRSDVDFRKKSKLVMCANTFLFTIPAPFPRFLSEGGMVILGKELLMAVSLVLQGRSGDYNLMCYVKAIMKITSQLFQNAGTGESMRGFLEGDFPRAITHILHASEQFHPSVLAYLFSAVADYINTEPANISFIVEAGIFKGFLKSMEHEPPAVPDYLIEVLTITEAFFLCQELHEKMAEAKIIQKLFRCFVHVELCDTVMCYEIPTTYGLVMERIVRHYPQMTALLNEGIFSALDRLQAQIGGLDGDTRLMMLENIFKAISCASCNPMPTHDLLAGQLLERTVDWLCLLDVPVEAELFEVSLDIIKHALSEHPLTVIEHFSARLNKVLCSGVSDLSETLEKPENPEHPENPGKPEIDIQELKRVMFIMNALLFSSVKAPEVFAGYVSGQPFLATIAAVNDAIRSHSPETTTAHTVQNLFYSLTLGMLRQCIPGATEDDSKFHYRHLFLEVFSLATSNLEKDRSVAENYTSGTKPIQMHLQALRNYMLLSNGTPFFRHCKDILTTFSVDRFLKETAICLAEREGAMEAKAYQKTVCCLVEVLSVCVRGIPDFFAGAKEHGKRALEIESTAVDILKLLESGIEKESVAHLVSITEAAFGIVGTEETAERKASGLRPLASRKRNQLRNQLRDFLLSSLVDMPRAQLDSCMSADILQILLNEPESIRSVYSAGLYSILTRAVVREKQVFLYLQDKLPELLKQAESSQNPALVRLAATTLVVSSVSATLHAYPIPEHLRAKIVFSGEGSRDLLEARGLLALAVMRVQREHQMDLEIDGIGLLVDALFKALPGAEDKSSLVPIINLVVRRATESRLSIKQLFEVLIKSKFASKSQTLVPSTLCTLLTSVLFYSVTEFMEYVKKHFERVNGEGLRHKAIKSETKKIHQIDINVGTLNILTNDLFSKPVKEYEGIDSGILDQLLSQHAKISNGSTPANILERISRAQVLCELVFNYPQLMNTLEDARFSEVACFLSDYISAKAVRLEKDLEKTEKETEGDFMAYWSGYFIVAVYNYTNAKALKICLMEKIKAHMAATTGEFLAAAEILQKILAARFSKNSFEENIQIIKESNIIKTFLEQTIEIDPRVHNYTEILQRLGRTAEYLTRVLATDEKEAFYEEPREIEEESTDNNGEGCMEDFDTNETMDSERTDFETEEERSSEVGISYTSEESAYVSETSTQEELFTERPYHLPENSPALHTEVLNEAVDFLKMLGIHSATKRFSDELKLFADTPQTFLKFFGSELTQALHSIEAAAESSTRTDTSDQEMTQPVARDPWTVEVFSPSEYTAQYSEDISTASYSSEGADDSYELDSEGFASEEGIQIGDENGDVPPMDVDVLNSLPDDILRDTIFQFYQERIASNTEYRPISIHFLERLGNNVRMIFEEEEISYFESFATERPQRKEKKKKPKAEHFVSIRDGHEIVDRRLVTYLIRMVAQCTNRKLFYKVLNHLSLSRGIRTHVVLELVKNIGAINYTSSPTNDNRTGTTIKRSLEALTYLCTKSDDFVFVFCEEPSLFNDIFYTISKKTVAEVLKLLCALSLCFVSKKLPEPEHKTLEIHSFLKVFQYDLQDEVFDFLIKFVIDSSAYFYREYLEYASTRALEVVAAFFKTQESFRNAPSQKQLVCLLRMTKILSGVGVTAETLKDLHTLRNNPFWAYFFETILPKERGSLLIPSLLPIFEAFVLVHHIRARAADTSTEHKEELAGLANKQKKLFEDTPGDTEQESASDSETTTEPETYTDLTPEEKEFYNGVIEKEKDIFNAFVQAQPELLFESFSGLATRILDFDNKRIYFYKKIETQWTTRAVLSLTVNRETIFEDTFHQLMQYSGKEVREGKFNIKFAEEEGIDGGGLTREWYSELSKEMFNPNYALFTPIGLAYQPNPNSYINPEHLLYFKFIGRIIGKAVHDGMNLDCYFTRVFYKRILGINVDLTDMEAMDPEFHRSLKWIEENDIDSVGLDLTFSIENDRFGVTEIVELKNNGKNLLVTNANKKEYVDLICTFKLIRMVERQLAAFIEGFVEVLDSSLVKMFDEKELELLISGLPEIDVDDWRNNTVYHGYTANSQVIRWFWRAVRNFSVEERTKLLQFATGTSKLPLEGFAALKGQNGPQKFQIHKASGSSNRLPSAHTCFNQLDLPEYEEYEVLVKNLLFSAEECSSGFGFA
ncbi:E3 ubiquitin-protein ligase HUWE1 [Nematocida displodere]|uniref:HECT-type E3 ubiquitin transferase n=1 Tax=Nematocida displodere TaxID=1805483 RepID=A0A177ECH4_9MICR|nr:E3 ubiquitin-protein ligase HUWE1 [Nematocida displodere]